MRGKQPECQVRCGTASAMVEESSIAEKVVPNMREQRAAMNWAGNGRKITIAVSAPATGKTCGFYGLDIAAWIREELVDMVMPYPFSINAGFEDIDMEFYCAAVKGTHVKLLPYVNTWRNNEPVAFLKTALRLCERPIDGFSIWNPYQFVPGWRGTDAVQAFGALGSTDAMRDCIERLEKQPPVRHTVRTQQGMKMDRYNYGWTY